MGLGVCLAYLYGLTRRREAAKFRWLRKTISFLLKVAPKLISRQSEVKQTQVVRIVWGTGRVSRTSTQPCSLPPANRREAPHKAAVKVESTASSQEPVLSVEDSWISRFFAPSRLRVRPLIQEYHPQPFILSQASSPCVSPDLLQPLVHHIRVEILRIVFIQPLQQFRILRTARVPQGL